jgi:hypothetical protein
MMHDFSHAPDWPSPRRAGLYLESWLADADEVRAALGARAARRFLFLTYTAEHALTVNFTKREDNHREAAARYLQVARAKNGAEITAEPASA